MFVLTFVFLRESAEDAWIQTLCSVLIVWAIGLAATYILANISIHMRRDITECFERMEREIKNALNQHN